MNISLNDVSVQMELNTGASVTVINKATYDRINVNGSLPPLQAPQVLLKSYTGEAIPVLGTTTLRARYRDKMCNVVTHVVSGDGPKGILYGLLYKHQQTHNFVWYILV